MQWFHRKNTKCGRRHRNQLAYINHPAPLFRRVTINYMYTSTHMYIPTQDCIIYSDVLTFLKMSDKMADDSKLLLVDPAITVDVTHVPYHRQLIGSHSRNQ